MLFPRACRKPSASTRCPKPPHTRAIRLQHACSPQIAERSSSARKRSLAAISGVGVVAPRAREGTSRSSAGAISAASYQRSRFDVGVNLESKDRAARLQVWMRPRRRIGQAPCPHSGARATSRLRTGARVEGYRGKRCGNNVCNVSGRSIGISSASSKAIDLDESLSKQRRSVGRPTSSGARSTFGFCDSAGVSSAIPLFHDRSSLQQEDMVARLVPWDLAVRRRMDDIEHHRAREERGTDRCNSDSRSSLCSIPWLLAFIQSSEILIGSISLISFISFSNRVE